MAFNPREHLINLQGKDYLETKWRICWFRDAHPTGLIDTELLHYADGFALVKASVFVDGKMVSTGIASADSRKKKAMWTGKEIMKAETAAIGRALAHAGYGTQFTGEDEGTEIADSPVSKSPISPPQKKTQTNGSKPAHTTAWFEDIKQVTAFVSWCKDNMAEYNQSDMMQALNDNCEIPIAKFVSMKQYNSAKVYAMDAVIAYECGYDESNIAPTIARISPELSGDKFDDKIAQIKLTISRALRNQQLREEF